jgi:hypothetical protein
MKFIFDPAVSHLVGESVAIPGIAVAAMSGGRKESPTSSGAWDRWPSAWFRRL